MPSEKDLSIGDYDNDLEPNNKQSNDCIDFGEWILKEGFEKYEDNGKCWWGKFKEEDKDYSTEQLYQMWVKSK